MKIILASGSPRRKELLSQIGLKFQVEVSEVPEDGEEGDPKRLVEKLSFAKAQAVFEKHQDDMDGVLVIGADTVVSCGGEILGKPDNEEDAARMLKLLSGREHDVFTGVAVIALQEGEERPEVTILVDHTRVRFFEMSDDEIREYVSTKDPMDKAGAYGIQGFCARYIKGIEGDYNNVVGLPVGEVYQILKKYM